MTFDELERQVFALALQTVIMPVVEIRLATAIAGLPNASERVPVLVGWMAHENLHVRRVALGAVRRLGAWEHQPLLPALLRCLADESGWVRHDAAWALEARGGREPEVLDALRRLADATKAPASEAEELALDIDDDALMARVQAAKALHSLGG